MSEERSRKVGKSGRPKANKKSEVGGLKSEEKEASAIDIPHSEIETLQTANSKLPTETMEVHHHPDVEKKTFKQYVLEGLMIFLAVFMGFIAENIRESIADHEHEQQYMESMVRDLALDTIVFNAGFSIKDERIKAIDTVFRFFENNGEPKTIPLNVYRNINRALWDRINTRNTATINQLKNAGGLRLIRMQDVRDSIAKYDQLWERADYYKEVYYTLQREADDMVEKMVNAPDLLNAYRLNSTGTSKYIGLSSSSIIRINTGELNQYLNFLNRQKITTTQDKLIHKRLKEKAVSLIKIIKKEYNIE